MRHLEIRDLWLQKEVADGKLVVEKVAGTENPADLMTKILTLKEIVDRLGRMGMSVRGGVKTESKEEVVGESEVEKGGFYVGVFPQDKSKGGGWKIRLNPS